MWPDKQESTDRPKDFPIQEPWAVSFNGRRYTAQSDAGQRLADYQRRLASGSSAVVLVGIRDGLAGPAKTDWESKGITLLSYVPDGGWVARLQARQDAPPLTELDLFVPFDAGMRVANGLAAQPGEGPMAVYVHCVGDRPAWGVRLALAAGGLEDWEVRDAGDFSYLAGEVDRPSWGRFLAIAAEHPDVQHIERGRMARLLNDDARRITQSGSFLGQNPLFDHGLYGSNQVIAVCDTGLDIDSCFFRDPFGMLPPWNGPGQTNVSPAPRKVLAVDFLDPADDPADPLAWDNHGHGTGVAGCAAGSDLYAPWDTYSENGMAPGAKLIIQDAGYAGADACADLPGLGCPVANFYGVLNQAVAQGAAIHNNSWNDREDAFDQNTYSEACRELDLVTWSNKHFLVVCAAGNNSLSNTVGSPSIAKNALSVGACLAGSGQERMAPFSSRGWASDGRIKPDLTAPGHNIRTAASDGDITSDNCYTTGWSGTSFAAPIVSGLAAQVRDYFAQGFYPTGAATPGDRREQVSAALVKAVLINASAAMTEASAPPPARDQGWGRINLSQTLHWAGDDGGLLVIDHPEPFQQSADLPHLIHLNVVSTHRPLKVTLVWSDYPSTPGADKHLVNDLDLRLRTPQTVLKGNVLENGLSVPGASFDRVNNVEQIIWYPESTGPVELSVWAHVIAQGAQDFALVVTGDFQEAPADEDTDADGLPDYWEAWHYQGLTATSQADDDGDGASNADEYWANTSPLEADSVARLSGPVLQGGHVTLGTRLAEARRYTLEWADDLAEPVTWHPLGASILGGTPVGERDEEFTDAAMGRRFYRLRIECPERTR